jgi:hypothetical protein
MTRQADAPLLGRAHKLSLEPFDRPLGSFREDCERWNNRFKFSAPKFIERYLSGDLTFLVFGTRRVEQKYSHEFCFGICDRRLFNLSESWFNFEATGNIDDKQKPMFVDYVVRMKNGQGVVDWIPSVVWLDIPNKFLSGTRNALYHSPVTGFFETIFCQTDGKLILPNPSAFVGFDESGQKIFQTRTQVVNDLSGDNGKSQWRGLSDISDALMSYIFIELAEDKFGFGVGPNIGIDLGIEISDILFGPLNLRVARA